MYRPPQHRELLEIESELRLLTRLIETAEMDRLRAHLAALARVNALIVAKLAETQAVYREQTPLIRGARPPEAQEKVKPLRAEISRLQQR